MKCPGQDSKYWKDDAIFEVNCPKCDSPVEFYKDDTSRKCPQCRHRFVNPKMDFGCASYCQFAEQCLGTLPEDFVGPRDDLIKDKVAVEVKRYYHTDFKSIRQATASARHAETIGKSEGGNLALILCATYLHGIDTGPAEEILRKVGANEEMLVQILNLLADQIQPENSAPSIEVKIISDALAINELQDLVKAGDIEENSISDYIAQNLFTSEAKEITNSLFAEIMVS